jgi:hypothetical protein
MSASVPRRRRVRRNQSGQGDTTRSLPPIICPRCNGPIVQGQQIAPLFSPKIVMWSAHPVLSKPVTMRGIISTNGAPGRSDLSIGEQLRQRAAMGGEKERAELAAFENLMARCIAAALLAQLQKEAAAQGVDVPTLIAREASNAKP